MLEKKLPVTAANLKNPLLGKEEKSPDRMLIPIFEHHNKEVKALVGKEFAEGTYKRYETALNIREISFYGNTKLQILGLNTSSYWSGSVKGSEA